MTQLRIGFALLLAVTLLACTTANRPAPSTATALPVAGSTGSPVTDTRDYAGLEQSRTSEGYAVLGRADAPQTLTMYSDFF